MDIIVEQITKDINTISDNYDDIDVRLLDITIDGYSPEESEKDTVAKISVDDCTNSPKVEEEEEEDANLGKSHVNSNEDLESDDLNGDEAGLNDSNSEELTIEFEVNVGYIADKNKIFKDIPDVLHFVNYNDIKNTLFNDCTKNRESLILNDNDKIFFKAMTEVRRTDPFVVFQRVDDNSKQYWFF